MEIADRKKTPNDLIKAYPEMLFEIARMTVVPGLFRTHFLNTLAVSIGLWFFNDPTPVIAWAIVHLIIVGVRTAQQATLNDYLTDRAAVQKWLTLHALGALMSGLCWASIPWLLFPEDAIAGQAFIILFLSILASAASITLGSHYWSAIGFITPVMLSLMVRNLLFFEPVYFGISIGCVALLGLQLGTAKKNERSVQETITLRFDKLSLLEESEDAKQQAEKQTDILDSTLEQLDQGICVVGPDMKVSAVNGSFRTLLGIEDDMAFNGIDYRSLLQIMRNGALQADPLFTARLKKAIETAATLKGFSSIAGEFESTAHQIIKVEQSVPRTGGCIIQLRDITDHRHSSGLLDRLMHEDRLTGLTNRPTFLKKIDAALSQSEKGGHPVAVVLINLDKFRHVNDNFGTEAGDELLCQLSETLKVIIKPEACAARINGDEFALLLPLITAEDDVKKPCERVLERLDTPFRLPENKNAKIRASIGVAFYPIHAESADTLLLAASKNMETMKSLADIGEEVSIHALKIDYPPL